MADRTSDRYQGLGEGFDFLKSGMGISQSIHGVLTLLFIKYVSDKFGSSSDSAVHIPHGASFEDLLRLKDRKDFGERLNSHGVLPIFRANGMGEALSDVDFKVDHLERDDFWSAFVGIFQRPVFDFSDPSNQDDTLLSDALAFLMRHAYTEAGTNEVPLQTPPEVARALAQIVGWHPTESSEVSLYDPACSDGTLLYEVAQGISAPLLLHGQEKDKMAKDLAVMNALVRGDTGAVIKTGDTVAQPAHIENNGSLKCFDLIVARAPLSVKIQNPVALPVDEGYKHVIPYGTPPDENHNYSFLLHIIASLNTTGRAAVVLPHRVLFGSNAEAGVRRSLIERKYIQGIIGLPANLFFGTEKAACILVLDKAGASERLGVFLMDASQNYFADGDKNRLSEQNVRQLVEGFNTQRNQEKRAVFVPFIRIAQNNFNLDLSRYLQEDKAQQNQNGHLHGGIPNGSLDLLESYWEVFPDLKEKLLVPLRPNYSQLSVSLSELKTTIVAHPEFVAYRYRMDYLWSAWKTENQDILEAITSNTSAEAIIHQLSENLLAAYHRKALTNRQTMLQHLMDYWEKVMKSDVQFIIDHGWVARLRQVSGQGSEIDFDCDLLPKELVEQRYFAGQRSDKPAENRALATQIHAKLRQLTAEDVRELVVVDKWLATVSRLFQATVESTAQNLANELSTLAERYPNTLADQDQAENSSQPPKLKLAHIPARERLF